MVGVVENVRHESIRSAAPFTLYRPLKQAPQWVTRMAVVAKTRMAPDSALGSIQTAVSAVDPTVPIHRVTTIKEVVAGSIARERLTGSIIGFYGALALLLSAVGVFGLLTFSIGERRKEIGIRKALGAQRPKILQQVVVEGMKPVLVGSGIGLRFGPGCRSSAGDVSLSSSSRRSLGLSWGGSHFAHSGVRRLLAAGSSCGRSRASHRLAQRLRIIAPFR